MTVLKLKKMNSESKSWTNFFNKCKETKNRILPPFKKI